MTDRIYWDACAWISFFNKEKDRIAVLRDIWEDARRGRHIILTSTFSYLEVIHGVTGHGQAYPPEQYDDIVYSHFDQSHVERVILDVEVAKLARKLKRLHHPILGKRSDAIHLATATYWNCVCLHTYDGSDLIPLHNKITCRNGKLLAITAPQTVVLGPLFSNPAGAGAQNKVITGQQHGS